MQLHSIHPCSGALHRRKRVGRGNASGHGTYSTRGCKGQGQHGSKKPRPGFEGGQTPLSRRLPKMPGFKNVSKLHYQIVNLRDLDRFNEGDEVNPQTLLKQGLISNAEEPVKILGEGPLQKKLTFKVPRFSRSAKAQALKAGGRII